MSHNRSISHPRSTKQSPNGPQPNITAAEIAGRFPNSRKDGSGFKVPCPAHNGEDANCYIGDGDDGGLVAKCWSRESCTWADIMRALDVPVRGHYAGKFVAAYQHNDGRNRNVYRTDKPDGTKEIRGKGTVPGTKLLAWGDDDGEAILVVTEGEKAAAAFQAFGLPGYLAVSYRDGAKSAVHADYSLCAGRKVAVWPDNDEEGLGTVAVVAQCAVQAGAESVTVLDVAHLNEKDDAADVDADTALTLLKGATGYEVPETLVAAHGGPRAGAGRPSFDELEAAEHIVAERPERFRQLEKSIAICGDNGLWAIVRPLVAHKDLHIITDIAQAAGIGSLSAKNARNVAWTIACNYWRDLEESDESRFISAAPVIGLDHDKSIDLATGETGAWPERLVLDTGARISIPDGEHEGSEAEGLVMEVWQDRYGMDLLRRLCSHLLAQSKSIDSVCSELADAGKGTMVSALSAALPGAVGRGFATKLLNRKDKFTPVTSMLSARRLVFLDEIDKLPELPAGAVHELADDVVQVENKGSDAVSMPRTGQLILLGADWVNTDASDQGIAARLRFFHKFTASETMTPDERAMILSPLGIESLQAMILSTCRQLGTGTIDVPTGDPAMRDEFIARRTPESKSALNETYETGPGFVTFSELSTYLNDNATAPSGKAKWSQVEVHSAITKTFPNVKREKVTGEGRGYAGLRKR